MNQVQKLRRVVIASLSLLLFGYFVFNRNPPEPSISWQLPENSDTVNISPDGKLLAVSVGKRESREIRGYSYGGRTSLELRNTIDGSLSSELDAFSTSSVAISSDNKLMATGTYYGDISIWNLETSELVWTTEVPKEDLQYCINTKHNRPCRVARLSFSPNNQYLVSYTHNQGTDVWNVANAQQLYRLDKVIPKITSDGKFVAFSGKPIVLHRISDGKVAKKLNQQGSIIFSPNGKLMAIYRSNFNQLSLQGIEDNPFKKNLNLRGRLRGRKFSPDGQYLAVVTYIPPEGGGDFHVSHHTSSSSKSKTILTLYRLKNSGKISQRTLMSVEGSNSLSSTPIAFSEDNKTFILGRYRGSVHLWNLEDLRF
ncbi:MAG: WD40 repeat domain-containing protein [Cyanobacteria bacterium P01_G01_bin.67]